MLSGCRVSATILISRNKRQAWSSSGGDQDLTHSERTTLLSSAHGSTHFDRASPPILQCVVQRQVPKARTGTPRPWRREMGPANPAQNDSGRESRAGVHDLGSGAIHERGERRLSAIARY